MNDLYRKQIEVYLYFAENLKCDCTPFSYRDCTPFSCRNCILGYNIDYNNGSEYICFMNYKSLTDLQRARQNYCKEKLKKIPEEDIFEIKLLRLSNG